LQVLAERGYEYDCSTLPTFIAPLARAYYFFKSPKMTDEERQKRKKLFGKFSDGFQSLKSRTLDVTGKDLVEIPVTTFPLVKTPIHLSYLLYLSTYSRNAALAYWRAALAMCRATGVQPSVLLHPLDFLSGEDAPELKFFPGMNVSTHEKLAFVNDALSLYQSQFDIVTMREHAGLIRNSSTATQPQPQALR